MAILFQAAPIQVFDSRVLKILIKATLFDGAPNPCRLLVIAPDEFVEALSPLIVHKNSTGMPAHLVKLSDIVGDAPPQTHPFAIKQLIAQGHSEFGVWYVMLAGDASKIPVRHRLVRQLDGENAKCIDASYNPTDHYYANLYWPGGQAAGVSDWDANQDGMYNESTWAQSPAASNPDNVDGYPHVAVGRVPAHTTQEIANYVQKVIDYEEGLRVRCVDAFTFLSDSKLPGSLGACDSLIVDSKLETLANAEVQRFDGNTQAYPPLPANWEPFFSPESQIAAFTAKWLVHVGHGSDTSWGIELSPNHWVDANFIRGWNAGASYSYPIVLSDGCDTGQFLNWAPLDGPYRGLDPDQMYYFSINVKEQKVEDYASNQWYPCRLTVPVPHTYDFPNSSARTFAHAWLCGSATGGAIAYSGAMLVHVVPGSGTELFKRFLRQVGAMNVLGDIWAQAQRDYFSDQLNVDDILGSPRIYLGLQSLYGDPSLRLRPVISYGVSAVMANNRLTVFARTAHGTLTHTFYDPQLGKWRNWIHLGDGQISSGPSSIMAGDRLTAFARTAHGTLTHKFYDPQLGKWTDWIHFAGAEISSGSSAVMAGDRLVVFARNIHGLLTHRFYDSKQQLWTLWIDLGGGQITSPPSAVMAGDRLTVFARSEQGTLTHKFYDPLKQTWTGWISLGDGQITSAPSAVMAGNRLTVFARSPQGTLIHKFYDPQLGKWRDWIPVINGQITSAPSAVMAGDRLTVFARSAQGILTHTFYDPQLGKWRDWIPVIDGQIS